MMIISTTLVTLMRLTTYNVDSIEDEDNVDNVNEVENVDNVNDIDHVDGV